MDDKPPSLCLAMIVKDEAASIEMTLRSVRQVVSYVLIVDTGSTDGTAEIATEMLKRFQMPGRVEHHPFVDFSTTKNLALRLAEEHAPWVLFLAGDEYLLPQEASFLLPHVLLGFDQETCPDVFSLDLDYMGSRFPQHRITRSGRGCKYVGRVHENVEAAKYGGILNMVWILHDGNKANLPENLEKRFARDLPLLLADIADRPDWARPRWYLAKTYGGMGRWREALKACQTYMAMEESPVPMYSAQLYLARCLAECGELNEGVIAAYEVARKMMPLRAEAALEVAGVLAKQGQWREANNYCFYAASRPLPDDGGERSDRDYTWRPHLMVAEHCTHSGEWKMGAGALREAAKLGGTRWPDYAELVARYNAHDPALLAPATPTVAE